MARGQWAVISGALCTFAVIGTAASTSAQDRPWPHMINASNGVTCIHQATACKRSDWLQFLAWSKLDELKAPAGGRAYRWLWVNIVRDPLYGFDMPSIGFVEVVVDANGSGRLQSTWNENALPITANDVTAFETALAKTNFATMTDEDAGAGSWLDYPPEQLMEADVSGSYHFVHRVGGISELGVRDAGVLLEGLARQLRAQADEEHRR